ncbi:hypothetical protein F441_11108 [Phytophthora nicotianae CJ01A1]|uniref:Chromo domain-containing protein n=1 Tax=Phytophthora nicotianae CJ01A1 TaxID=1317063 RepID=W2WUL7_PHYNI|nr:hypothetical protein F441_11108 [Phytophthora nicotianae CJ01A1]
MASATPPPLCPLDQDGFVWPTIEEIGSVQALYDAPKGATLSDDELRLVNDVMWIPSGAHDLTRRLLIVAHYGRNGHCGMHVMENHIRRLFYIGGLTRIVRDFCSKCLLCLHTLHWDFLTLGDSFGTSRYTFVLKDKATHFTELVACDSPTSEVAAKQGGGRSRPETGKSSRVRASILTLENGSVERVNRDILQVLTALALEYKVSFHDWPYLLPLVQSSINHSPVPSLANRAPVELFTGLPCPSALDTVFFPGGKGRVATLNQPKPSTVERLTKLRENIRNMHKSAKGERQRQAKRYRLRPHYEQPVNFSVGDYVLRSRVDEKLHANKLRVMWIGPYRVVGSIDYYFTVEHLVSGKTMDVHPSRLNLYADDSLNVNEDLINHIASQGTLLAVEAIMGHRLNADMQAYEVKVKWLGLETIEDSWEPLKTMSQDVPQLLLQYANEAGDDTFLRAPTTAIDRKSRQSPTLPKG